MDYRFEEVQYLKFAVYDVDDKRHIDIVSHHDFIGETECTLADIVTSGQRYNRSLRAKGEDSNQSLRLKIGVDM